MSWVGRGWIIRLPAPYSFDRSLKDGHARGLEDLQPRESRQRPPVATESDPIEGGHGRTWRFFLPYGEFL